MSRGDDEDGILLVLSFLLHPIAYAAMWSFLDVPFLVIPCLYFVIAVTLGVRTIKLMAKNKIRREYIMTFGVLNFTLLLGTCGFLLLIQLLRNTASHCI